MEAAAEAAARRHVYELVVAQLAGDGLGRAARAVADAVLAPLPPASAPPPDRLLALVRKGLAAEEKEGGSKPSAPAAAASVQPTAAAAAAARPGRGLPLTTPITFESGHTTTDASSADDLGDGGVKREPKAFLHHASQAVSEHKACTSLTSSCWPLKGWQASWGPVQAAPSYLQCDGGRVQARPRASAPTAAGSPLAARTPPSSSMRSPDNAAHAALVAATSWPNRPGCRMGSGAAEPTADVAMLLHWGQVEALRAQFAPTEEGALAERPNIRVYLDHAQSAASADGCLGPGSGGASAAQQINDADFHPTTPILISAANDSTIKFFDFRYTARQAFRVIQDTHRVKSVAFHPCGEYVLAGTEHALLHLYDVNTFKCFLSAAVQPPHIGGAVRYSQTGAAYASCHKDGAIRLWDGVTGRCVRVLGGPDISTAASGGGPAAATTGAGAARPEATSVAFSRDQKYLLTCGQDGTARLWDIGSGQQVQTYSGGGGSGSGNGGGDITPSSGQVHAASSSSSSESSSFICIEPSVQASSGAANGCREQGGGQAVFDHVEELVLSTSGVTNEVVVWDVVTGKEVARLPSGHTGTPITLAHSPAEAVFATVGADHVVRLWVEQAESL
eukprot:SM000349S12879  [mRNA]  locus=s349:87280:90656:+ [translate_table: standard]